MPEPKLLRIKQLSRDATQSENPGFGDLGIDLFSSEDVVIPPLTMKTVHSGVAFQFPEGYGALLRPRGKDSFLIGSGVIDCYYRDEILVRIFNTNSEPLIIKVGDSIGQMVLIPFYEITVQATDAFSNDVNKRRSGGIHHSVEKKNVSEKKIHPRY